MRKARIIIICLFITILILLILFPSISSNYKKGGKLYINEILASNSSFEDNEGDYSDYIEIYNGYNNEINLNGYHLSDNEYKTDKWTFPEIIIGPKEYLIIYASGKDTCDIKSKVCHTNFKLSSKGETITLSDKADNIISKFSFDEQYKDISYGYKNGRYIYFETPTPGEPNESNEYVIPKVKNYKLEITEYMTKNKRSNYDKYGNYYDWIEIYNPTDSKYTLDNLYVTDNEKNLRKFKIPSTVIESHGYLIVYFAGDKTNYEDGIYADFKLSSDDKYIIITNGEKVIDKVELVELVDNISYGKVENKWKYFSTPTPGYSNTTAGFTEIGGLNGSS